MSIVVNISETFNPRVFADIKSSPGLQRNMARRGIRVQTAARKRLGANPKRIDTGRLRSSIAMRVIKIDGAWGARIFTNVEYAIYVHEGTRPHTIRPRSSDGVLVFTAGGDTVFTTIVNHPGMEANPFLRDALKAARL